MTDLSGQTVKLSASDTPGEPIEVPIEVANQSVTIKNMLEDFGGEADVPIPLHNVTSKILALVVKYCTYHLEHPAPKSEDTDKEDKKKTDDIIPWDKDFCDVEQSTLFELILSANYLDIRPLLNLTCKTVANMVKGKTPEEIRETFNITNDFTPEEEEKVRKENEWCEER